MSTEIIETVHLAAVCKKYKGFLFADENSNTKTMMTTIQKLQVDGSDTTVVGGRRITGVVGKIKIPTTATNNTTEVEESSRDNITTTSEHMRNTVGNPSNDKTNDTDISLGDAEMDNSQN